MAALAKPEPLPVGSMKQFGPWGPAYEVLGWAEPVDGKARVRIILVHSGEETTYGYDAMMQEPEAR